MGEMVAWSREAGIGTPKHPPFAAWLVRAWFTVFPLADWSYYLFAMVLATLRAVGRVARVGALSRRREARRRPRAADLRSVLQFPCAEVQRQHGADPALGGRPPGGSCARSRRAARSGRRLPALRPPAAMLGKYWSIFLLAGLGVAALADPRRGAYFRSAAPWVTIAVGALALAPHVAWIVANDFAPFTYAVAAHPATRASAIMSAARIPRRRRRLSGGAGRHSRGVTARPSLRARRRHAVAAPSRRAAWC